MGGQVGLASADPDAVGRARQALDELESAWRARVDRMSGLLTDDAAGAGPGHGAGPDDDARTNTEKGPDG